MVIGRQYFLRQAATLLKSALSTNDAELAAALVERADDLLPKLMNRMRCRTQVYRHRM
jgi:hypothetical protein